MAFCLHVVQGRGGIFPRRAVLHGVPAISRHGGTLAALGNFAKCSLVNAAGLKSRRNLISEIFAKLMQVRQATIADARTIAQIHVETWRAAYRGRMPDVVLDSLDMEKRAAFWKNYLACQSHGTLVAELNQNIVGFCDLIPSRDQDSNPHIIAEIVAIYVHPNHWRQGAGRALCHRTLAAARHGNFSAVTLWVLASNMAARNFYQAMGFQLDSATKSEPMANYEIHEVRYRTSI